MMRFGMGPSGSTRDAMRLSERTWTKRMDRDEAMLRYEIALKAARNWSEGSPRWMWQMGYARAMVEVMQEIDDNAKSELTVSA